MRFLGNSAARFWIYAGMTAFFVRFTSIFYHANREAIDAVLGRLFGNGPSAG